MNINIIIFKNVENISDGEDVRTTNIKLNVSITFSSCKNKIELLENKYIDCFEYNSFTDKEHVQNPIAKITGTDEIVFWYENINNGIVMFMPDVYFSQYEKPNGSKKEKNFLEDTYEFIQNINKKSMQDIPKWLSSYETSEEKELNKKINKIDNDIKKM